MLLDTSTYVSLRCPLRRPYLQRVPRESTPPRGKKPGRKDAPGSRDLAKQQTRDALLSAALELFAEEGLDAPSLDAICERAGYTRGAFYIHFADRDALLVAVMEKVGEAFLVTVFRELGPAPEATPGRASVLATVVERFVAASASGKYPLMPAGGIRPHQLLDACARSPALRERYRMLVTASIEQVAEFARIDQAAGHLSAASDPKQIGTMLLAIVIGAQTMFELGVPIDPAALARTALAAVGA